MTTNKLNIPGKNSKSNLSAEPVVDNLIENDEPGHFDTARQVAALGVTVIFVLALAILASGTSKAAFTNGQGRSSDVHASVASDSGSHQIPTRLQLALLRANNIDAGNIRADVAKNDTQTLFNTNAFLLASRLNNESQLASLQMQPFFGAFTGTHFANSPDGSAQATDVQAGQRTLGSFDGVGFPHIETSNRPEEARYKPYRQLVSINGDTNGDIVPHVKCMGLSPERVAARAQKYDGLILELALEHRISASLVKAVVTKESCFNASARSHAGAIGLMQLMPETARWLKVAKPENETQNLAAGVRYLAQLKKRFGSNELALAAYNAGPGNVERYNGIPPFAETQAYVRDVMHFYRGYVATTRFVNALGQYD